MAAVPNAAPRALPRLALRAVPARLTLGAIVLAGTVVQALLARSRVTPSVFPDEYVYSQLARSLATTGRLRIRGVSAHFPAVLEPVLTAPVWLVHDVGTAYRLVQLENAFAMSLAAVPAYLIARRLRVATPTALAVAAFAIAGPQMLFVAILQSEPFAYPLALGVVAAALAAIERPSLRAQALLLVLSVLVSLARLQLAALPLCAAAAVVVVGLRERRLRAALREQRLLLGVIGAGLAAGVVFAVVHGFGYYKLVPAVGGAGSAARMAGADAYVVLLGAGVAIVPAALAGIAVALWRPRSRGELAFGVLAPAVAAALLLQSVLWGDVQHVQERYLGYLLPLLGIGFALRCSRADRRPVAEIGVAAGIALVAVLVPLNGYALDASHREAPVLYAFNRLDASLHTSVGAAIVFLVVATALAAAGALGAVLRRGAPVALGLSLAASAALLAGGTSWSGLLNQAGRARYLPPDKGWVDHAAGGQQATMLVAGQAFRGMSLATLFWNPSLAHVVRLPQATRLVAELDDPVARVDALGLVHVSGRPLTGPVLVEGTSALTVALRAARPVAHWGPARLWRPRDAVRLGTIVEGRLADGRVTSRGRVRVWGGTARLAGWIEVRVQAPASLGRAHVVLRGGGAVGRVSLAGGGSTLLRVPACGAGPWRGHFTAGPVKVVSRRLRSPLLSVPRYVADASACG